MSRVCGAVFGTLLAACGLTVAAAPASADVYPSTARDSYWLVVTDKNAPQTLDNNGRYVKNDLFANANKFWAANSGGKVQHDLIDILYAPIQLNADGTRPNGWRTTVNNYVQNTYGVDLSGKLKVYDLAFTKPSPGQTWVGQAAGGGDWIELQSRSYVTYSHELGHVYGLGHANGFRKGAGEMYVWDTKTSQYVGYPNGTTPHTPMPFGIDEREYGHSNSIMGSNGSEHVSTRMKRSRSWLFARTNEFLSYEQARSWEDQRNDLRVFSHNDLTPVVDSSSTLPRYGVAQGYNQDLTYSFEYERIVKRYALSTDHWVDVTQKVMMEFWLDDTDPGLHVYMDPDANDGTTEYIQVDVNNFGGWQFNPKVTTTLTDLDLGTSFFIGNGDNFINDNPLAPLDPMTILPEYFSFTLLGSGTENGRNYMDVRVNLVTVPEPGIAGLIGMAVVALAFRRRRYQGQNVS